MIEKIRLVVGVEEEGTLPTIIGAVSQTTWEVIPEEDWQAWRQKFIAAYGMDDLDWRDIIVEVDAGALKEAAATPSVRGKPTGIEEARAA